VTPDTLSDKRLSLIEIDPNLILALGRNCMVVDSGLPPPCFAAPILVRKKWTCSRSIPSFRQALNHISAPPTMSPTSPVDEETPLLGNPAQKSLGRTPLPWVQLVIVILLQMCEPLTAQVINPFTPQVCCLLFLDSTADVDVDSSSFGTLVSRMGRRRK